MHQFQDGGFLWKGRRKHSENKALTVPGTFYFKKNLLYYL